MKRLLPCLSLLACTLASQSSATTVSGPVPPAVFSPAARAQFPGHAPLRGVDFWGIDAMDVPEIPSKNFLPNPAFRQGLRYWGLMGYGPVRYTKTDSRRFEIVASDRGAALLIRTEKQVDATGLCMAPVPLLPGKTYTLSCYAKSDRPQGAVLTMAIVDNGGFFFWKRPFAPETQFPLTEQWKRYSRTFTLSRSGPESVYLNAEPRKSSGEILVTDLQLEEGAAATAFAAPEAEGLLKTSSSCNTIDLGTKLEAKFAVFGDAPGKLRLKLFDYWRKALWEKEYPLPLKGELALPFDELGLGAGTFCLQAVYALDDQKTYRDYYRFSVVSPLAQGRATKYFFGTQHGANTAWDDLLVKQLVRLGFLNRSYTNDNYSGRDYSDCGELLKEHGVVNQCGFLTEERGKGAISNEEANFIGGLYTHEKFTPADEKKIEDIVYRMALARPDFERMALSCEGELHSQAIKSGHWDEWEKAVMAAWRGLKRGNPKCQFFPDTGTSCYLPKRGRRETEELLKIGERNHVKWDFVTVHPYSTLDGGYGFGNKQNTLDESLSHLLATMKRYGYGKDTPVYVTECFNLLPQYLPQWDCSRNADVYTVSRASYDFSREERNQAAWAARTFLVCLKYFPQVRMVDLWNSRYFHDVTGSLIALPSAVNTLCKLFPDPEFVEDFQPDDGVFAYLFKGKDGLTTAALWTNREDVEKELTDGVAFELADDDPSLTLIDLMGNAHPIVRDGGKFALKLDAAPLFLVAKDGAKLAAALRGAAGSVPASSLRLSVEPKADGSIVANVENRAKLGCAVTVGGAAADVPASSAKLLSCKPAGGNGPGALRRHLVECQWRYPGQAELAWKAPLLCAFVPYAPGAPDWKTIPGFAVPNNGAASDFDFSATCQLAWNEDNFYVRLTAVDDQFQPLAPDKFKAALEQHRVWELDGGLEFYLDAGGNGKANYATGMDNDDYRYDFAYATLDRGSGKGTTYRRSEPDAQIMAGNMSASKEEAAANVKCDVERLPDGYAYTLTIPKRYLSPMALATGSQAGMAFSLIDIDGVPGTDRTAEKRLCLTASGALPNDNPADWLSIVLVK